MNLDRAEFLRAAEKGVPIPLVRDLLADVETPLSVYWKLSQGELYSFLLESVTGGEQVGRYSMVGVAPRAVARVRGGVARIEGEPDQALAGDPLTFLREHLGSQVARDSRLPKFVGGAVGVLSYDFVRYLEDLGPGPKDDLELDDLAMMLTSHVVVFDHAKNLLRIIVLAEPTAASYEHGVAEIALIEQKLSEPLPPLPTGEFPVHPVTSNFTQEKFEAAVTTMKSYITAGDGVQMVPSQRLQTQVDAHPLTLYRALRSLNPSPYMFLMRFGDFDLVGASPEILVSLDGDEARVRPIAGTRWRGQTEAEDLRLEAELLADEKERAEHVMLIDLGRNDLGRVCDLGTVKPHDLMVIERYSHVMHIVSDVRGKLRPGLDAFDLVRATFPAGTVSGAPKVRAMQIIDEVEPQRRGLYAGAAGVFSRTGDVDLAIILRTIVLRNGQAYVQAGAGVVFDSDPTKEYEETLNKARAALRAIELAQQGLKNS